MLLVILIACPAEQLGIELPEGGEGSISQEDVKRDVWLLAKADDAGAAFTKRLGEMHVDATEGACGRRDGPGPARVLVAPWPTDTASRVQAAALISLAKGWDTARGPSRTTWLCLDRGELPEGERVALPAFSDAETDAAVDYVGVQKQVVGVFRGL